jgi:hypothetical protein
LGIGFLEPVERVALVAVSSKIHAKDAGGKTSRFREQNDNFDRAAPRAADAGSPIF